MKPNKNKIAVELIDTSKQLTALVKHLNATTEIAVDTEFDSFNKQYGIHLQLIQIFDGSICYLVDPLKINDLKDLWHVFENPTICKVVYSGANDVDVLKRQGCSPVNLFDLQIAAELLDKPEKSLSAVLKKEFDVELDKSIQAAGWGNRPLETWQLAYAASDVIYLLRLKELLEDEIGFKKIQSNLQQQNIKLETAASKDYFPKLSKKQYIIFNKHCRNKLLDLKLLVDVYAQKLNLPPFKIVQDSFLEELVKDPKKYSNNPMPDKKFHVKLMKNEKFRKQLLDIILSIDASIGWQNEKLSPRHR